MGAEYVAQKNGEAIDDSLRLYLIDIGRYPLLKAEDERLLGRYIRAAQVVEDRYAARVVLDESVGSDRDIIDRRRHHVNPAWLTPEEKEIVARGNQARKDFVNANLRLVVSIAKKYEIPKTQSRLDLISDGNIGLMHAVEMFDSERNIKFSTYATKWIHQAIRRGIADTGRTIRLPDYVNRIQSKLKQTEHDLTVRWKRHPKLDEVAREAKVSWEQIVELFFVDDTLSIEDARWGEERNACDVIADKNGIDEAYIIDLQWLKRSLSRLSKREQYILLRHCMHEATQRTIGDDLGISRQSVTKLGSGALQKLRESAQD